MLSSVQSFYTFLDYRGVPGAGRLASYRPVRSRTYGGFLEGIVLYNDVPGRIASGEELPREQYQVTKNRLSFDGARRVLDLYYSTYFQTDEYGRPVMKNGKLVGILTNRDLRFETRFDLPIENVQTGSLATYKVTGTPTVLFVDNQGIVRSSWFGAQSEREPEMRAKLVELFDAKNNN